MFQVFADYASMVHPMKVPRKWLWNLENRTVYFGTTVSSIMRGNEIHYNKDNIYVNKSQFKREIEKINNILVMKIFYSCKFNN